MSGATEATIVTEVSEPVEARKLVADVADEDAVGAATEVGIEAIPEVIVGAETASEVGPEAAQAT